MAMALAALSVISCATDGPLAPETSSTLPPAPTIDAPDQSLLGGLLGGTVTLVDNTLTTTVNTVDGTLTTTVNTVDGLLHLLTCSALPDDKASKWIGPNGGTIRFGASQLSVPRGALKSYVQITAEQVSGDVNSVRFSPEGLKFAKPATLTMGYSNCEQVKAPKQIVYTDEALKVLEVLKSRDSSRGETVSAPVNHFSRYAVSW
jgi:hypothetical protein